MEWLGPKNGESRIIKKFAWLPVDMTNENVTVWLGKYYEYQSYFSNKWTKGEWVVIAIHKLNDFGDK